ncbi:hypothetical protein J6590_064653 [Homalodisca vitripennis]|nr:hypothetical protein J6590_064653 [Homalodisca vitripennis]
MEDDNDEYILQLLDESFRSGEGDELGYNSDNLVEIFDDDSDADPDFVVSEHDSVSDGDIVISQPGPSTSTKRKIFSSTPKKHLSHKKPRLCVHNQQDKTITLDSQNTSDNQSWKPVDSTFNVYPYNPENEAVGINPDIIDSMVRPRHDRRKTDARPQLYALAAQTKRETSLTLRPDFHELL